MTREEIKKRNESIVNEYKNGKTVNQLSVDYDLCKSSVTTILRDALGVRNIKTPDEKESKVIQMRKDGCTFIHIGKELNIHSTTAARIWNEYKLKNNIPLSIPEPKRVVHEYYFPLYTDKRTGKTYRDITDCYTRGYEMMVGGRNAKIFNSDK